MYGEHLQSFHDCCFHGTSYRENPILSLRSLISNCTLHALCAHVTDTVHLVLLGEFIRLNVTRKHSSSMPSLPQSAEKRAAGLGRYRSMRTRYAALFLEDRTDGAI